MRRLYGIDEVLIAHFDRAMLTEPWDTFLSQRLTGQLQAGMSSAGTITTLDTVAWAPGEAAPGAVRTASAAMSSTRSRWNGQDICSTRIRALLAAGQLEQANCLLGHPHCLTSPVIPGSIWGTHWASPRRILPSRQAFCCLPYGVYAAKSGSRRRLTPP